MAFIALLRIGSPPSTPGYILASMDVTIVLFSVAVIAKAADIRMEKISNACTSPLGVYLLASVVLTAIVGTIFLFNPIVYPPLNYVISALVAVYLVIILSCISRANVSGATT